MKTFKQYLSEMPKIIHTVTKADMIGGRYGEGSFVPVRPPDRIMASGHEIHRSYPIRPTPENNLVINAFNPRTNKLDVRVSGEMIGPQVFKPHFLRRRSNSQLSVQDLYADLVHHGLKGGENAGLKIVSSTEHSPGSVKLYHRLSKDPRFVMKYNFLGKEYPVDPNLDLEKFQKQHYTDDDHDPTASSFFILDGPNGIKQIKNRFLDALMEAKVKTLKDLDWDNWDRNKPEFKSFNNPKFDVTHEDENGRLRIRPKAPKYVYHGTTLEHARNILENGLRPRGGISFTGNPHSGRGYAHERTSSGWGKKEKQHHGALLRIETKHLDPSKVKPNDQHTHHDFVYHGELPVDKMELVGIVPNKLLGKPDLSWYRK